MTAAWHAKAAQTLGLPPLRDLDQVVAAFDARGFAVSAARLELGFVPTSGHRENYFQWFASTTTSSHSSASNDRVQEAHASQASASKSC